MISLAADGSSRCRSSGDAIHIGALNVFMRDFDFDADALDVALRKLLMGVSLPKETQQIDRVMEAFAKRYDECHPGLLKDPGEQPVSTVMFVRIKLIL